MAQPSTVAEPAADNVAHALAGAGGGLLSMTLTYPLITLSTRAQVESRRLSEAQTQPESQSDSPPSPSASSTLPLPATASKPKRPSPTSTLAAAQHILRREGVTGLYSGLSSALFGISITNFVYYYWYEWTRAFFLRAAARLASRNGEVRRRLTAAEAMIAGAVAGAMTVLVTNPIWVVNTRMTTGRDDSGEKDGDRRKRRVGTLGALMGLLRDEGVKGLFKGVLPALVLVINPILQYTIFEQLRNALEKRRKVGAWDVFFLGALGKAVATGLTYPYITVKSRMHVAKEKEGEQGEGMGDGLRRVVREEGWTALYKGIGPKVSQSVITAAFLFAFKDVLYEASVKARRTVAKRVPGS